MLVSLHIENFALIDQIELKFENGFTVFTGETGSGKSILLGALNLILGERADYSVIRDQQAKTVVEGKFTLIGYDLESFFAENDLDFSVETIIRREITNQGKSRAFVNDTPVQLNLLKTLSERLIHIHSQHHTLELKSESFQLDVLDYLTGSIALRQDFRKNYFEIKNFQKLLQEKQTTLQQIQSDADYVNFQLKELENLNLEQINYLDLEKELEQIEHFDQIQATFEKIVYQLGEENLVLDQLKNLKNLTEKQASKHASLDDFTKRFELAQVDLKDIHFEAESILDSLFANPKRKTELEDKLSIYNSALTKHHAIDQQSLMTIYLSYKEKDLQTEALSEEINQLIKELDLRSKDLLKKGETLHQQRIGSKTKIEEQVKMILSQLKMDQTEFLFDLEKLETPTENGYARLQILFSPNAGMSPKAIEKTASGGELSRLMLAIQLLMSERKKLPSLLFDEIDTGVSGEVAQKLGNLLKQMGVKMQVMAITHLPQVAAKGDQHFKVAKSTEDHQTQTSVNSLNLEQRIAEIARLMSGEQINASALDHAKELMGI